MEDGHESLSGCLRLTTCEPSQRLTEIDAGTPLNGHPLAFIHIFPPAIVIQVFISFVDAHSNPKRTPYVSAREWNPLLLLGGVCKEWRDITLKIPELWATITTHIPQDATPLCLEITEAWLNRSGGAPLSLTLRNMDSPHVWDASRILASNEFFQLLRSHSSRWKSLDINCPFSIFNALFNGLDLSSVDRLRITIKNPIQAGAESRTIIIPTPFAPKDLYIASFSLLDSIPMRWDRLLFLEAHTIGANELLHILQRSINLQVLKIGTTTRPKRVAGNPYPEPTNPFVMHSLLSLDMTAASVKCSVIWHLTLPALRNLKWSFFGPASEVDLDALAELLDRSSPDLENFTFLCRTSEDSRSYSFPDERSYNKIPGVTHLVIGVHPTEHFLKMGEDFLHPLAARRRRLLLPRLEVLDINAPMLSPTSWSYIDNIVQPENIKEDLTTTTSTSAGYIETRRHIRRLSINLQVDWSQSPDEVLIDEASYLRLCEIRDSGVDVTVAADHGNADVLERYMDIYKGRQLGLVV